MRALRITTNLPVSDIESAKGFYTDFLGLSTEEFNYEITHPLTTEEWGVRRFHVRAPDGTIVNVVAHRQ